jgi:hypothetical protein
LLPAYVLAEPDRWRLAAVWAVALALATLRWRRSVSPSVGLAVASVGLLAAAGVASRLSDGRTGGRDAVRVIGQPALQAPGLLWERSARAEWTPFDLDWGPLYEPHRYAGGAVLGSRLMLPAGRYRLLLEAEDLASASTPPDLEVRVDGPEGSVRRTTSERVSAGFSADFAVGPRERVVSLRLCGGGPLLLLRVRLSAEGSGST